jgi:hypothetical protein
VLSAIACRRASKCRFGKQPAHAVIANRAGCDANEAGELVENFPTGKKIQHTILLDEMAAIETVAGVQARLKNLGYYLGRTDGDKLDPETVGALIQFQTDHDLKATGIVDDATKQALAARHGS